MGESFPASVVIVTKNRKDELRRALNSCLIQTVRPEMIVIDDGSTDGTAEMVAADFPHVRFIRSQVSCGYIVQRNLGARVAGAPIVFSLDDDAEFSSPRIIEQALAEFDHPRIGAVAIRHIDVNYPPMRDRIPEAHQRWIVDSYIGLAHALRRDLFLHLSGYREFLFHQTEELDYCTRMVAAGYVVRASRADPVNHYESLRRDRARQFIYGARNNLLRCWYYVPLRYLPIHMAGAIVNLYRFAIQRKHPIWISRGIFAGFVAIWQQRRERRPLRREVYQLIRLIIRSGGVPLETIEDRLPEMVSFQAGMSGGQETDATCN